MKKNIFFYTLAIFFFSTIIALNAAENIKINRLSDRVAVFTFGPYDTNIAAIASKNGLIVIDTFTREITTQIRKMIETEFKRNDFAYLINTHGHFDHFIGNQVYSDIQIVGHENAIKEIKEFSNGISAFLASRQERNNRLETELKTLPENSPEKAQRQEVIKFSSQIINDLKDGFIQTPPTKTFSDSLILEMGDLHVNCYYYEGAHSTSDILIYIPEEELLISGDLFSNTFLPISLPIAQNEKKLPIQHWIEILNSILNQNKVKNTVSAGGSILSREDMLLRFEYISGLWQDMCNAKKSNYNFAEVSEILNFQKKYNFLTKTPFPVNVLHNFHQNAMKTFWKQLTTNAALKVEETLKESGLTKALEKYNEMKSSGGNDYFFDETDFNALGYKLLQENKTDNAIAIFKLNVETYPNSYNAYDSLAEAYNIKGDKELAVSYYLKSFEKNTSNSNAVAYLNEAKPGWMKNIKAAYKKLSSNIYRISCPLGLRTNIIAFIGSEGTLLIDTGQPGNEPMITDTLTELGNKEIKFVINTHKHGDHMGNNKSLAANATIIDGENYKKFIENGTLKNCTAAIKTKFNECYSMSFNDTEIILIPTPGTHSSSDMFIYFPKQGIAHLGDLLLTQSFPAISETVKEYMTILESAILTFPEETIFIGGHGKDFSIQDLKEYRAMLNETIEITLKEMQNGKDVFQMRRAGILDKYSEYNHFLYWLNTNFWIGSIYKSYSQK